MGRNKQGKSPTTILVTVLLVRFLAFLDGYEVSFHHPWASVLCPWKLLYLYSDFYVFPFDLAFGPILLLPLKKFDKHLIHS
jgi:hypothetical protein